MNREAVNARSRLLSITGRVLRPEDIPRGLGCFFPRCPNPIHPTFAHELTVPQYWVSGILVISGIVFRKDAQSKELCSRTMYKSVESEKKFPITEKYCLTERKGGVTLVKDR